MKKAPFSIHSYNRTTNTLKVTWAKNETVYLYDALPDTVDKIERFVLKGYVPQAVKLLKGLSFEKVHPEDPKIQKGQKPQQQTFWTE